MLLNFLVGVCRIIATLAAIPYTFLEEIKDHLERKKRERDTATELERIRKYRDATWQGKNLLDCCLLEASGSDIRPGFKEIEAYITVQRMKAKAREQHILHEMPDEWWDEVVKEALRQENMRISWKGSRITKV